MNSELIDLYCIMSDFNKKEVLEKIKDYCIAKNIKTDIKLVSKKLSKVKSNIKILENGIKLKEMLEEYTKIKAILEIIRDRNKVPSMRTMDCIGLKKKLITNNKNIIYEDFYNPNNILVIDENNIEIPKSFFENPCIALPEEIYIKYSLKNWIRKLLN